MADNAHVPLDRTDLAEVLGNLLENAARHASARVSHQCRHADLHRHRGRRPGHRPRTRRHVLERGTRLDQRGDGAGLGLAIVQDVLSAYGWRLDLAQSDLGGLKATIAPQAAGSE